MRWKQEKEPLRIKTNAAKKKGTAANKNTKTVRKKRSCRNLKGTLQIREHTSCARNMLGRPLFLLSRKMGCLCSPCFDRVVAHS